jgi:hypothetical protein
MALVQLTERQAVSTAAEPAPVAEGKAKKVKKTKAAAPKKKAATRKKSAAKAKAE